MIISHFAFPHKSTSLESALYFRVKAGTLQRIGSDEENDKLTLSEGACVSFDTYFNIFSYVKFVKYTNIRRIHICLSLSGRFRIRLLCAQLSAQDVVLQDFERQCDSPRLARITQPLDELPDHGFMYIEITALSPLCVMMGGSYEADETPNEAKPVRLAVVVCTHKRESYVYATVESIRRFLMLPANLQLKDALSVMIIDNGGTIDEGRVNDERTRVCFNKNLGGSGGFTRGLIEALESPVFFSHVCLMDDDIALDPEVLFRTHAFLSLLSEDHSLLSIGGTMLVRERPYEQYEAGGLWTGRCVASVNQGLDARDRGTLFTNDLEIKVDYNAWWYACIPTCLIVKHGLPLPLFIKGDDIDYGLRALGEILIMNGIAVWHDSFESKELGIWEYYIKRNELILSAIHPPKRGVLSQLNKLLFSVGKALYLGRDDVIDLLFQAYADFLIGVDFLAHTDGEFYHTALVARMVHHSMDSDAIPNRLAALMTLLARFNTKTVSVCWRFLCMSARMIWGYRAAVKSYRTRWPELTTLASWRLRLGLPVRQMDGSLMRGADV